VGDAFSESASDVLAGRKLNDTGRPNAAGLSSISPGGDEPGLTGSAAYTASKYGLLGFSRVLAEEMRAHGVRVAVLSAGATDTSLWDAIPSPPDRARMLRPDQVAEAALAMAVMDGNATLEEVTLLPAGGVL
jgi:3-oxoacyl-[acyl-carrier protein] reductase